MQEQVENGESDEGSERRTEEETEKEKARRSEREGFGQEKEGRMNVAGGAKKKNPWKINLRRKKRSCNEASNLNPLRPPVSLRYWLW